MPIYEYQCQKCGVIEVTQRITEKSLVKCPTCKSKIKKLISNTSFQLKGTGWYITDYARKGQTNGDAKSEGSSKSSAPPATESKSETKKSESSGSTDKTTSTTSSSSTSA
ncbi:MAG TPA: FmdB family zinc ribbon protein [Candidatus Binatia bacterium]|jgi:putative FmdB family regulatory protein|nr:FmdB family zinc ribbon protein [Candidatus Binatia bacterium]